MVKEGGGCWLLEPPKSPQGGHIRNTLSNLVNLSYL